ncbi:cell division protein ZapA [Sphingobium boeckii]|uniref:Cell division protein ZapA n=1 Tax=Sphingobium boeckii TaxID=1082345 RepID=A0A7W9EDP2_9SPHN|nr:cell division protein ZapA [Sphingobium boeckii]MBB5685129.1 cell division protein ZapA [Sphingobium boeckii]
MAEVLVEVAGRSYPVNCRDGEENHLRVIASLVDAKAKDIQRAVGGVNETRQMLLAALLLADELNEVRAEAPAAPAIAPDPAADMAPMLEKLAARVESLADRLETADTNA